MIVAVFKYLKTYFVKMVLYLVCTFQELEFGPVCKVPGRKTSAQCKGGLGDWQSHAEVQWAILRESEFCATGDVQTEIRSHLVGLS